MYSKQSPFFVSVEGRGCFDVRGIATRGTMSAELDALTVVNQLRDLAADPLNRRAIVEDQGCLPGLILFLDHPNPQVVYSALLVSSSRIYYIHTQDPFASQMVTVA